ncbi:hypothetical protein M5X06_00250 [Paenibacillus alvei]|uniref:Phage protein n=2 Tax=Paenibacillus alvei TaxID=44250 RepID=A0ABT4H3J4_PAEAL|nr:hypothetical protein [Paenibacillus alvei]MCY9763547.1 hypothetical protein [Paenibacillus alvei]MCY9765266.1 hypothetical protein [Paenibacillus alvei]
MASFKKTKVQARIPISTRQQFKKIAERVMVDPEKRTETQVFIDLIESEYKKFTEGE